MAISQVLRSVVVHCSFRVTTKPSGFNSIVITYGTSGIFVSTYDVVTLADMHEWA